MPITKSAKKALRQNIKRRRENLRKKRNIRKLSKELDNLISNNKLEEAKKLLPKVYKALDKAAKTKVIKKGTANRKKSRLTKRLNKSSIK